ncbi:MAG TPA: ribonuclease III [Salinisphaeraceae bacterium]|nr:ribonuclease III [Salinisphaeraceae bacterium]
MSDTPINSAVAQQRLQQQLGYSFADKTLLRRALTHRSACADHNERLEFLGDSVLSCVISMALFEHCPQAPEGDLSRLRAALVCERTLAAVARQLELSALLVLGPGEKRNGSGRRDSILADTLEALLGAVYREGGFGPARAVILALFAERLAHLPDPDEIKDPKTRLQEWLQARGRALPQYQLVSRSGADHAQHFVAACRLPDGAETSTGEGSGRRKAEQAAARNLLAQLTMEVP